MEQIDQNSRFKLKFHGVRGSIPTPCAENLGYGGNTTCLEIRLSHHEAIIIDGGTGARNLGTALAEECQGQKLSLHFLLTHFHWDHIQGIPFFSPLYNPSNDITFHSGRSRKEIQELLKGQMSDPYFPVNFELVAAKREFVHHEAGGFKIGNISVRSFPLNHPQKAWGYRLEVDGVVLVHASDFEHGNPKLDSVLREYAQDADVLIYDAHFTPEEYESKRGWGHSTWLEATRVASDAHVKKLILFHHDPSHNDLKLASITEETRKYFENTDAAREGCIVQL